MRERDRDRCVSWPSCGTPNSVSGGCLWLFCWLLENSYTFYTDILSSSWFRLVGTHLLSHYWRGLGKKDYEFERNLVCIKWSFHTKEEHTESLIITCLWMIEMINMSTFVTLILFISNNFVNHLNSLSYDFIQLWNHF